LRHGLGVQRCLLRASLSGEQWHIGIHDHTLRCRADFQLSIDRLNGNVQRDGTTLERGETFFGENDEIVIRNDRTRVIQAGAIRGECLDDGFIDVPYRDCYTWNDSPAESVTVPRISLELVFCANKLILEETHNNQKS
jgi:hypothetical protein